MAERKTPKFTFDEKTGTAEWNDRIGELDAEEVLRLVDEHSVKALRKVFAVLVVIGYVYVFRSEIASLLVRLGAEVE